jgi:hypothetical protein
MPLVFSGQGQIHTSGVVPIGQGGTGQTTKIAAANALLPTQTPADAGKALVTNGSGTLSWGSVSSGVTKILAGNSGITIDPPSGVGEVVIYNTGGGGGGGSTPAGPFNSIQYNDSGVMGGAESMRLNDRLVLTLGNGNTDKFLMVGAAAASNLWQGSSIEIRGGPSLAVSPGETTPAAGDVLITGGIVTTPGTAAPGDVFISGGNVSLSSVSGSTFIISNGGELKINGEAGDIDQILFSGGTGQAPYWDYLPIATEDRLGGFKRGSGLIIDSSGRLRTILTSVDDISIKVSDGQIYVPTVRLVPQLNGGDLYLKTDGASTFWASYELTMASTTQLGAVKIDGTTITILPTGMISASINGMLPSQAGKDGYFLSTNGLGALSWSAGSYTLQTAGIGNDGVLGGVKLDGDSIQKSANSVIFVDSKYRVPSMNPGTSGMYLSNNGSVASWETSAYSLPTASQTTKGGVRIDGTTIKISSQIISADVNAILPTVGPNDVNKFLYATGGGFAWASGSYILPTASNTVLGGVKTDNITTFVNSATGRLTVGAISTSSFSLNNSLIYNNNGVSGEATDLVYDPTTCTLTSGKIATYNSFTTFNINGVGSISLTAGTGSGDRPSGSVFIKGGRATGSISGSAGGSAYLQGGTGISSFGASSTGSGNAVVRGGHSIDTGGTELGAGGSVILATTPDIADNYVNRLVITNIGTWVVEGETGTNKQVLMSTGPGTPPKWEDIDLTATIGLLPIESGGTGKSTRSEAINALLPDQSAANTVLVSNGSDVAFVPFIGDPMPIATASVIGGVRIGSGLVIDAQGILSAPAGNVGTVTSISMTGGSTGLTFTPQTITSSGTFGLGGTLGIANGGTNATNARVARNNLLPIQSSATFSKVLKSDGSDVYWGDVDSIPATGDPGQIQYNNAGILTGSSRIFYNGSNTLTVGIENIGDPTNKAFTILGAPGSFANEKQGSDIVIQAGNNPISGSVSASVYLKGGTATAPSTRAGDVYIDGGSSTSSSGGYVILRTQDDTNTLVDRLVISSPEGAWAIDGDYGLENMVLTSNGPDAPPTWRLLNASAFALTGATLSPTVTTSSLTSVGTLTDLNVSGKLGVGTEAPQAKTVISLGDEDIGIELEPGSTSKISSINRLNDFYTPLAIEGRTVSIATGANITASTRLTINSNGSWNITGSTGDDTQVLTSTGPGSPPEWKSISGVTSVDVSGSGSGLVFKDGPINISNPSGVIQIDEDASELRVRNGGTGASTAIAASQNINNFGQLRTRTSVNNFNNVQQWGATYVAGSINGPSVTNNSGEFYQMMLAMGSDFNWSSSASYAAQIAIPRNQATPYVSIRFKEGGTATQNWGSWQKLSVGYADLADNVSGIVAIANGGTEANNREDALKNLLPETVPADNGKALVTDGAGGFSWSAFAPQYQALTATAGQTIFNTTIPVRGVQGTRAYIQVFVNGVLQIEGSTKSYTVTNNNRITFNNGLSANDDVVIYSYV